jgi:hypothetical protein
VSEGASGEVHEPLPVSMGHVSANVVREWVRAHLIPTALERLYDIGMGEPLFQHPRAFGLMIPAEAHVQQKALQAVIAIGVPPQVGLTSDAGEAPGVIALGPLDLDEARAEVHAQHAIPARTGGVEVPAVPEEAAPVYIAPEGHEVIEVAEGMDTSGSDERGTVPNPPEVPTRTKAQEILERRRARRAGKAAP